MKSISTALLLLGLSCSVLAQGMLPATRANIHTLFDNHKSIRRTVTVTTTGYKAVTESDDPVVAKALRAHVSQMQDRLKDGLAVRRWDPAYDEMSRHYKDISLEVTPTSKGLKVEMIGKTPEAVAVARNHGQIVMKFVERGWDEHDVLHEKAVRPVSSNVQSPQVGDTVCGDQIQTPKKCCADCRCTTVGKDAHSQPVPPQE